MQIEREIKLQLPPDAAPRVWREARAAGRRRRRVVSTVYFETRHERVRRSRSSLRLRRDGRNWLQALKSESPEPTGIATRTEWELPAPGGRLDLGAFPRAEILAATGLDTARLAGQLRPLFETRFTRTSAEVLIDGATRAEICVDLGYLAAGEAREPISEIEIELKSGNPAAVLRYAEKLAAALGLRPEFDSKAERGYRLAAGEPFAPPRKWRKPDLRESAAPVEAFAAIFAAALTQAGANVSGVLHGNDPEFLHQMRVGLRRLRSALRAFRKLVPRDKAKPLAGRLEKLMPLLGSARDWDVFCDDLARVAAADAGAAPAMRVLLAKARGRRASARHAARNAVASPAFQAFMLRSLRWLQEEPWKTRAPRTGGSLARFGAAALGRLHRKALREARGIDWRDSRRRHRLRIRVKRLRYASDFFAPCFARASAQPYLKRLQALQDILGELNDVAVARRLLAALAPRGSEPEILAAARHARHAFAAREGALIASLEQAWRPFEKRPPFWRPAG